MNKKRIGIVGFDGVTALDIVGPAEAFASAYIDTGDNRTGCYDVLILSASGKSFVSESGIAFHAQQGLTFAHLDTVIIPGGSGLRTPEINKKVSSWLKTNSKKFRRIASVCTGIYGLATTGFLDGREVTTHWRFARDVAKRFSALRMNADALYLKDGRFYTSAGITASIDLSLALIEEDFGSRVALAVARELVVYLKRIGGQEQYSEPLRFQSQSPNRLVDLVAWISGNLDKELSMEVVAEKIHVGTRQLNRLFLQTFDMAPGALIQKLRVDEARRRLSSLDNSVEEVAYSVGFHSPDVFRRIFEKHFGIPPSVYRSRFYEKRKLK